MGIVTNKGFHQPNQAQPRPCKSCKPPNMGDLIKIKHYKMKLALASNIDQSHRFPQKPESFIPFRRKAGDKNQNNTMQTNTIFSIHLSGRLGQLCQNHPKNNTKYFLSILLHAACKMAHLSEN